VKVNPGKVALGAVGLAVGFAGVIALRGATLSTHQPVAPDSQTEVIIEAESEHAEPGQTVTEMAEAIVLTCRLEVTSDLVGEVEALPGFDDDQFEDDDDDDDDDDGDEAFEAEEHVGIFRAVLQPALDETNQRQFRGCLEDWTVDQLLVDVLRIQDLTA
jgi:hypothetical protein